MGGCIQSFGLIFERKKNQDSPLKPNHRTIENNTTPYVSNSLISWTLHLISNATISYHDYKLILLHEIKCSLLNYKMRDISHSRREFSLLLMFQSRWTSRVEWELQPSHSISFHCWCWLFPSAQKDSDWNNKANEGNMV